MIEIAPGCWQMPLAPRQAVNAYLLGDVLVDAGMRWSARRILAALKGRAVRAHALTHAHPDHQGASHAICKALMLPLWTSEGEREAAETGGVSGLDDDETGLGARMQRRLAGPGHPVARELVEGDVVGGFEVVAAPGHTAGQIAFWRASDRTLIAADAAVGMDMATTRPRIGLPPAGFTENMSKARGSVRKLAALGPARVAFGHGPMADGAAFRHFADAL